MGRAGVSQVSRSRAGRLTQWHDIFADGPVDDLDRADVAVPVEVQSPAAYSRSPAASRASPYDTAFALIASNSSWLIVPASRSSFALAISAADPPEASRTY